MLIPDRITAEWLRKHGACEEQVAAVEREWPNGARPLLATALKAARLGFHIDWLAPRLLSAPALAAYREAIAPALAAYDDAIAQALLSQWQAALTAQADALSAGSAAPTTGATDEHR